MRDLLLYNGCSTPFGVIGLFTLHVPERATLRVVCSTPFGVIGLFTPPRHPRSSGVSCAQRRLASLDCSPNLAREVSRLTLRAQRRLASLDCSLRRRMFIVAQDARCSTPFGVIGLFTAAGHADDAAHFIVLNAVWRHWIVHPQELLSEPRETVVLNAVWRHWIVHYCPKCHAQRA